MVSQLNNRQWLDRLQPLASLPESRRAELAERCERHAFARAAGKLRITGWPAQRVYLVKGEAKLQFEDGSFKVVVGGTQETCKSLSGMGKGLSGVQPITDIELLSIDEDVLDITLTWDQMTASVEGAPGDGGRATAREHHPMSGIFSLNALTQGAFSSLPPAHIGLLLERFEPIKVCKGEVILRQGDPGDYYYLIDSGRCAVTRRVVGDSIQLADLKEGDAFGEEALVSDVPRNATVTMKTDGVLLRLRKHDFVALLREPLMQRLHFDEARQRVALGARWIDVRYPAEFQTDGLDGAQNLPLNELRNLLASLDPAVEYVTYCQTGRRSSAAAFIMSQRGLRASVLAGGLKACHMAAASEVGKS